MFMPFATGAGWATGAAAAAPVTLSGIKADDILLAVIQWAPGSAAAPVAVADFVVTDDAIESPTVDTDTYKLFAIWTRP